jgi:hypothetical protein
MAFNDPTSLNELSPTLIAVAERVAAELNETNPKARSQIRIMLKVTSQEFVENLVAETLAVEEGGGMLLPDTSRRRTVGGVFFQLAKQKLDPDQRAAVFPSSSGKPKSDHPASPPAEKSTSPRGHRPAASPAESIAAIEPGPEARRMALDVARQLRDNSAERLEVFARLVEVGGEDMAQEVLEITLDMENQGGLRKKDGTRRSPGGAFLYIASRRLTETQKRQVWPQLPSDLNPPAQRYPARPASRRPATRSFAPAGIATTAKIVLIGRPSDIQVQEGYVIFRLQTNRVPSLPRGLPLPPANTPFTVCVADKMWERIAPSDEELTEAVIIEGFPAFDASIPGFVVFATSVTNRSSQRRNRDY